MYGIYALFRVGNPLGAAVVTLEISEHMLELIPLTYMNTVVDNFRLVRDYVTLSHINVMVVKDGKCQVCAMSLSLSFKS